MKIENIRESLLSYPLVHRLYAGKLARRNRRRRVGSQLEMEYKLGDLRPNYYAKVKANGDRELEHQIGRLTNYRRIIKRCASLPGHMIEFGTYRGFSLLWIAYLAERAGIFNKHIIGLDSFTGLSYSDGSFGVTHFSDTSLNRCRRNILRSRYLYQATKRNISIDKFFFRDKEKINLYLNSLGVLKLCFVHIDCDVSKSFKEVWALLSSYDLLADQAYVLLDDYGLPTKLAATVNKTFSAVNNFNIKEDSSTNFTKNFIFTKK